jgi:diketogulonate reductase-like aldo/keto reductase
MFADRGIDGPMPNCRRAVLTGGLAAIAAAGLSGLMPRTAAARPQMRAIPSSGEAIPAVGLGTWITFNVGADPVLLAESVAVMAAFFEAGGTVIDSSPMYASSQDTVGHGLARLGYPPVFAAEKVWTPAGGSGREQITASRRNWGVPRLDLMQVHNMVDWREHLETLFAMKASGEIRYVGITTSHGSRHDLVERIMREHQLDFVQLTYNILDREPERRLLPLARDRGIAVMVNRPFRQGTLIRRFEGRALPGWANEIAVASWAQYILKFILSHPAVTVVIPATTRTDHVRENLAAATDKLPDEATRRRMLAHIREL